jgi:MOSC domain-containing protein YiiM
VQLLSVNIASARPLSESVSTPTGIFKQPIPGSVEVGALGLAGDHIANKTHHGGPDQAVYVYSQHDYAWWEQQLNRTLAPGWFGENLTLSHLGPHSPRVGDVWQFSGGLTLHLTGPRIPCSKLAARMGDPGFVKAFVQANRGGVYARVLQPSAVQKGESVTVVPGPTEAPTIDALFELWHQRKKDPVRLRHALDYPLGERLRQRLESWLVKMDGHA